MSSSRLYLAGALLALLGPQAAAADSLRDLTVEQAPVAAAVAPNPGNLTVSVSVDREDATYAAGEVVRMQVTTNQDAYVTVLDVGPNGDVAVLFPNRFQTDNHLQAGSAVEIGGPGTGASLKVSPPTGTELIKVVASLKPLALIPDKQLAGAGPFRSVKGGSETVSRDLQGAAEASASTDAVIAFSNFGLTTIASRTAATAAPEPSPVAVAPPADAAAEQPFPLLIAADKASYHIGDKPAVVVSTAQACRLTVTVSDAAGAARTIFPTGSAADDALGAFQSVFVSGGPGSDVALAGSAGEERIVATCNPVAADAAAPSPAAATASLVFTVKP